MVLPCRARKKKHRLNVATGNMKSIFRFIIRIGFDLIAIMILQITMFTINFFRMEDFDRCCVTLESKPEKEKSTERHSREHGRAQSDLSNWV